MLRICTATAAAVIALAVSAAGAQAGTANGKAEARMVAAINGVRAQHGLHALQRSGSLSGSASRFSHWLMENNTFRHLSSIRASQRFSMLGEALATHSGRRFDVGGTLRAWVASPAHRAIVLSPVMRLLGAGVTRGSMGASSSTVWVLHVGRVHPPGVTLPNPGLPLP